MKKIVFVIVVALTLTSCPAREPAPRVESSSTVVLDTLYEKSKTIKEGQIIFDTRSRNVFIMKVKNGYIIDVGGHGVVFVSNDEY